jgi:hypothetical protein
MDTLFVYTQLGKTEQFKLSFANPLDTKVTVVASWEENNIGGIFHLLDENCLPVSTITLEVDTQNDIEIPFDFTPISMNHQYTATINVIHKNNPELVWKYPIKGIPEVTIRDSGLFLASKARNKVTKNVVIKLPESSIPHHTNLSGIFNVELSLPGQFSVYALAIEKAVFIEISNCTLSSDGMYFIINNFLIVGKVNL